MPTVVGPGSAVHRQEALHRVRDTSGSEACRRVTVIKNKKKKSPRSPAKLSTLDDFLKDDGKLGDFQATAIKELLAWQTTQAIKADTKRPRT